MKKALVLLVLVPVTFFFTNITSGFVFQYETSFWAQDEPETRNLPILMYHQVLNSRKGKYIVNERQLENDFLYLKDQGYTTVFLSEVIDWIDGKGKLPPKPIVLTFDDGHYNNMHYAVPIAKKHGIKFMIMPVTGFSEFSTTSGDHSNPNYSHLTFDQIGQLAASGTVEFGSHTHKMHKFKPRFGVLKMPNEDTETYRKNLINDVRISLDMIQNSGAPRPLSFAYPFGKYTTESENILKEMGFRAMLTCTEGVSIIKQGQPEDLHRLKRYNRDGHKSTESIFERLNKKHSVD